MPSNDRYHSSPHRNNREGFHGGFKKRDNYNGGFRNDNNGEPDPYLGYHCCGNLGLLFTRRYYSDINKDVLDKKEITVAKQPPKGRQKGERTDHQTLFYNSRNNNIIRQAKSFIPPQFIKFPDQYDFTLSTIYPGLLIGSGILHSTGHKGEAKLGLLFDHTTGLPYIPGSSLKGLLRSMFPLRDVATAAKLKKKGLSLREKAEELIQQADALLKQADQKRDFIANCIGEGFTKDMVDDLERSIFEGVEKDEKGKPNQRKRNDIFFDAFPIKAGDVGLLGLDYITPHTKSEFQDPNPIQFMRIAPGVSFRFQFQLHKSERCGKTLCTAKQKEDLFREILTTVGIGAKTNVGYGQLK